MSRRRLVLYHGTSARNVVDIRRYGIRSFYPDGAVFLTDDPDYALGWAQMRNDRAAVFRVRVRADRVTEQYGVYRHQGDIPAKDVKLHYVE